MGDGLVTGEALLRSCRRMSKKERRESPEDQEVGGILVY